MIRVSESMSVAVRDAVNKSGMHAWDNLLAAARGWKPNRTYGAEPSLHEASTYSSELLEVGRMVAEVGKDQSYSGKVWSTFHTRGLNSVASILGPGVIGLLSTEKDSEYFMEVFPDASMQFCEGSENSRGTLM